jgi:hypothetical protein
MQAACMRLHCELIGCTGLHDNCAGMSTEPGARNLVLLRSASTSGQYVGHAQLQAYAAKGREARLLRLITRAFLAGAYQSLYTPGPCAAMLKCASDVMLC